MAVKVPNTRLTGARAADPTPMRRLSLRCDACTCRPMLAAFAKVPQQYGHWWTTHDVPTLGPITTAPEHENKRLRLLVEQRSTGQAARASPAMQRLTRKRGGGNGSGNHRGRLTKQDGD